ncbi:glycosyltransferase [Streptomyces sp. HPF1205]|uniref:MGDG synthase family glycosyltransferase n=1 Tax=Streptomyces sp. HPF1205 TaxID=2873262 RepID=UPI001CEC78CD|nr:glycosyltransferase [Streptomyces sp. HPF1205]
MGGGHDAVAAELARRLRAAGHSTRTADVLALLPPPLGAGVRAFYRTTVRHFPVVYGGIYAAFFRGRDDGRGPSSAPLADLARERLAAVVAEMRADVVVPVFHLAAQLTGRMRADGSLGVPSAVVVTDFAVHRQWLHPGNDLHLCLTADAADEVRRRAGRPAVVSGPLVSDRFRAPRSAAGRRGPAPDGGETVLVSAGAWGVGSGLEATARLLRGAGYLPVVACGRDERLRRRLSRHPGVRALGWVDDMPGLLAAASVVVDNAAGQTALEALARGVPVVGYRPIPGHGADGVRRMAALGLSDYARGPWELVQCADRLTAQGAARQRRVAAGLALFERPGAVAPLEALAAGRPPGTPAVSAG